VKSLDWHLPELKRHFSGIETQTGDHNRPEKAAYLGIQVIGGTTATCCLNLHLALQPSRHVDRELSAVIGLALDSLLRHHPLLTNT
jgi:hypothetical protein